MIKGLTLHPFTDFLSTDIMSLTPNTEEENLGPQDKEHIPAMAFAVTLVLL